MAEDGWLLEAETVAFNTLIKRFKTTSVGSGRMTNSFGLEEPL